MSLKLNRSQALTFYNAIKKYTDFSDAALVDADLDNESSWSESQKKVFNYEVDLDDIYIRIEEGDFNIEPDDICSLYSALLVYKDYVSSLLLDTQATVQNRAQNKLALGNIEALFQVLQQYANENDIDLSCVEEYTNIKNVSWLS